MYQLFVGLQKLILSRRPSFWAICYVVTFLVFGGFYLIISRFIDQHSFYQSTSRFEPRYFDDEASVARHLESDIRRVLRLHVPDKQHGNYRLVVGQVSAFDLRVEDQTVTLRVDVPVIDDTLDGLRYNIVFTVTGRLGNDGKLYLKVSDHGLNWIDPHSKTLPPRDRVDDIAGGNPLWSIFMTGEVPALSGPTFETDAEVKGLIEESQGWPSVKLSNYWVRMFYLSAITITTTGYGDILPLTTPTRVLTGLEALLGTLWFGLFLYSLPAWPRT